MQLKRIAAVIALAALAATLSAQGIFGGLSQEQEIELGRQVAAEIEKQQPILPDERAAAYIDQLGQALAAKSQRNDILYQFKIVDSPEINAFAVPGGFIYINRGLIEAASNEAELAGVVGHEIGHIVGRHSAEQIRRAQVTGLGLRVLGGLLGDGSRAAIGNLAAQMVASGAFMRFSRDAEREADRLGAQNVHDAGIDPRGMVTFFEKLAAMRESQPGAVERFFSSHPNPAERRDNISNLLPALDRPDLADDSSEFRAIQRHLRSLPPSPEPKADGTDPDVTPDLVEQSDGKPVLRPDSPPELVSAVETGSYPGQRRDREIAEAFAPVFYQALGESPRYDYITNFDFDGDWRGDNNWANAARTELPLLGWIYYSVAETPTHFYVHYAAFHPRDYKGGARRGSALSELIREGVRAGERYDPTGRAVEAVLAHENDLEGALVVAEKNGSNPERARVRYVETLAHNQFLQYVPDESVASGREIVTLEGRSPRLFVEPKGHGIEVFRGDEKQLEGAVNGLLVYRYTGRAEDPDQRSGGQTGYDLVPFYTTLWPRAQNGVNETYGLEHDYGVISIQTADHRGRVTGREAELGVLGSSFNGLVGGQHMARPAWGWFDGAERDRPLGEWFFSPAETIKRHFSLDDSFSTAYRHHPVLGVFR